MDGNAAAIPGTADMNGLAALRASDANDPKETS